MVSTSVYKGEVHMKNIHSHFWYIFCMSLHSTGVNIFVAFFVLLLLLAESTPSAVKNFPLIGVFYCLNMIMITLSTFLTTLVIHLYFRGDRKGSVPLFLRRIVIEGIGRLTLVRQRVRLPDVKHSMKNITKKPHRRIHTSKISSNKFSAGSYNRHQNERNIYSEGGLFPACNEVVKHSVYGNHCLENVTTKWFATNDYRQHSGAFYPHVMGTAVKSSQRIPENIKQSFHYEDESKDFPYGAINYGEFASCDPVTTLEHDVRELKKYIKLVVNRQKKTARESLVAVEWRTLAIILDRLFFFIYITTILIAVIVLAPRNVDPEVPEEFQNSED